MSRLASFLGSCSITSLVLTIGVTSLRRRRVRETVENKRGDTHEDRNCNNIELQVHDHEEPQDKEHEGISLGNGSEVHSNSECRQHSADDRKDVKGLATQIRHDVSNDSRPDTHGKKHREEADDKQEDLWRDDVHEHYFSTFTCFCVFVSLMEEDRIHCHSPIPYQISQEADRNCQSQSLTCR